VRSTGVERSQAPREAVKPRIRPVANAGLMPAGRESGTRAPRAADSRRPAGNSGGGLSQGLYSTGSRSKGERRGGAAPAVSASFGGEPYGYDHGYGHGKGHHGRRGGGCGYWHYGYYPTWYGYPKWYPWAPSPWEISHGYAFGIGFGRRGWRFGVGFGFNYAPWYFGRYGYPCYRSYSYYPYAYYDTVAWYPAYSAVYHYEYRTVEYVESADPYVEFTDDVEVVPAAGPVPLAVPEPFLTPLVADFPEGLSAAECLTKGHQWLKEGLYLYAAEAFRRVWLDRSDDYYPPLQLGLALAAAERIDLASYAISEGLDRNASWVDRNADIQGEFSSPEAFQEVLRGVQRFVVKNPLDGEGRFLLGYLYYFSANPFGAYSEFSALKDGGWESPHLEALISNAEKRLLEGGGEVR
jgi:hypothetical protein